MISLQPQEIYTIVRQLGDHTDSTSYYVRAVIRDSVTDTVLKTLNLTQDATDIRRFKGTYQVPADVSGLGFYIDMVTSVYTDSAYTTKASTYSDEGESYLVFDRITRQGGGGGGGSDVDYKKVQKMLDNAVKSVLGGIEKADNTELAAELLAIKKEIAGIDIPKVPEFPKLDLSPVLNEIAKSEKVIVKAIDDKEVTEIPEMDPFIGSLDAIGERVDEIGAKIDTNTATISEMIAQEKEMEDNKENTAQTKLEKIAEVIAPIMAGVEDDKEEDDAESVDPLKERVKKIID